MNQGDTKIKSFTDLRVWQEGHRLVLMIYKITKTFPKEEVFGLVTQMRRAAISFTSCVAEGFSRQSYKEKLQFYSMALGSLTEIQNQLLVARDIGYVKSEKFTELANHAIQVNKMINGLIKKSKSLIRDS
jgi:four helix bundle protein